MTTAAATRPEPAGLSLADRAGGVGLVLALSLSTPGLLASLLFAAGQPLSPIVLVVSTALIVTGLWRSDPRHARWQVGAAAGVIALSLALAASIFDLSFDGQTYHQEAVRALANGWNPVWHPRAAEPWAGGTYIASLPKAAWVLEALVLRATGSIESAKGVHLIALVAAFLLSWCALDALRVRSRAAVMIAALAAATPVTLIQILTFYLDGLMASSLTIVLALGVLFAQTGARRWAVALVVMSAFTANLKFPAAVYITLLSLVALGLAAWRAPGRLRAVAVLVAAAGGAALLEGINPFVTNTILHGHPAYPAAGRDALPLAVHFEPVFAAQPRLVQVTRSLMSYSSDNDSQPPRAKLPFSVHPSEIAAFTTVDTRIGGWGPLFGGALLFAWVVLTVALVRRDARAPWLVLFAVGVAASTLAIPFGHYARYTPHLWLAAVAALLVDDLKGWATKLLTVVLVANLLLVAGPGIGAQLLHDRLHRAQLRGVVRDARGGEISVGKFGPFVNVDLHLQRYGIRFRVTDSLPCERPARLLKTHARLCLPNAQSPEPEPEPLRAIQPALPPLFRQAP